MHQAEAAGYGIEAAGLEGKLFHSNDLEGDVAELKRFSPGELVRCVVVDSDGYDLVARPVEEIRAGVSLPVIN